MKHMYMRAMRETHFSEKTIIITGRISKQHCLSYHKVIKGESSVIPQQTCSGSFSHTLLSTTKMTQPHKV